MSFAGCDPRLDKIPDPEEVPILAPGIGTGNLFGQNTAFGTLGLEG